MSKTYKTISRPAITETVLDKTFCDICGKEIKSGSCYDVDEVIVSHRTGEEYPEGGSGETISADICGKCFDNKIVPFIESFRGKLAKKEWETGY